MTSKVPLTIVYTGGAYGRFVNWSLEYFSGRIDGLPFNSNGNSHNFKKSPVCGGSASFLEYINSNKFYPITCCHPKIYAEEDVVKNFEIVLAHSEKVIYLDASNSIMLVMNNKYEKIWEEGWLEYNYDNIKTNLAAWNPAPTISEMATWELREFLSFYIMPQHLAESGYHELLNFHNPNMLHLHVEDLFENFETTIRKILEYSGYTLARSNFDEVFSAWRPLQKHYRKQELIDDIVDATINDKYLEWSNLSLIDEAIVQMRLRDLHKLDMMCYNVNVFPTNTTDLRKLLINV
jgi:hypothetical protein